MKKPRKIVSKPNVEQLAAKAKLKRMEDCGKAVEAVLITHNCTLYAGVLVNDQWVKVSQFINLPSAIQIESK